MGKALDKKEVRLVKTINQYRDCDFELKQVKDELRENKHELYNTQMDLNMCRHKLNVSQQKLFDAGKCHRNCNNY